MGLLAIVINSAITTLAHQPRMVENEKTEVEKPDISKAYYGTLKGRPDTFLFRPTAPFDLYVGILLPDGKNAQRNMAVLIYRNDTLLKEIGGENAGWKNYFEPFGQDAYLVDGEYKVAHAETGAYKIIVTSFNNKGKYALVIGEKEFFDLKEIVNAVHLIPILRRNFFEESPVGFIKSFFGWGYILITYLMAFAFGLVCRMLFKKLNISSIRKRLKNIGRYDRLARLGISIILLLLAITTTWNFWLIFLSGFALFESIFSWCGLYAAIEKNTCPV